jgi:hypothetical protein
MENEELEADEKSPIIYEDTPFFNCELTSLNRIAFSVADDPFFKQMKGKYYPECVVYNAKGKVLAVVGPTSKSSDKYGLQYFDDIREQHLKINDDRKVRITLSQMRKPGKMVLFTVRTFDNRRSPPKQEDYERAWYRLVNEDTN